jgi:xanthine dehydrogenase YagS FAD-binding subunit
VQRENVLASHEVLTDVIVPEPFDGWRGTYLKARERTAGDFPLVSAAVGYALPEGRIRQARVVLGGVAPIPWPSAAAVAALEGEPLSAELATRAAEAALAEAQPLRHNAFKVEIGRALVARAILAVGTV